MNHVNTRQIKSVNNVPANRPQSENQMLLHKE